MISSRLLAVPGASSFFTGGVVCYSSQSKFKLLALSLTAWEGSPRAALVGSARRRSGGCSHRFSTAASTPEHRAEAVVAPTLDKNLRKLLFMVHPDMFPDGSTEKRVNLEAVKSINSYVDSHRSLIEGNDDAELPITPGRQPTMIKLYVRQQTQAEPVAVAAMLQDTTQAQPKGFEKSMDK